MSPPEQRPPDAGIFLESTRDERLGVLPGEDRLVRTVMCPEVVSIDASRSLLEAAEIMRQQHVSALVVTQQHALAGILTQHDMVVNGLARGLPPRMVPVKDLLGDRRPISCSDTAILAQAAGLMADHHLQSIPVVDAAGAVVGTLSFTDVLAAVMPEAAATWLTRLRHEATASTPHE